MLQITPSDRRVLQLLADEKPMNEIASCLGIAVCEVDSQLAALFARMGVSTRADAVSSAWRRGLLTSRCCGDTHHTRAPDIDGPFTDQSGLIDGYGVV